MRKELGQGTHAVNLNIADKASGVEILLREINCFVAMFFGGFDNVDNTADWT